MGSARLLFRAIQAASPTKQGGLGWGGGSWAQDPSAPGSPRAPLLVPGGHPPAAPVLRRQPAAAQYFPHGHGHCRLLPAPGQWREGLLQDRSGSLNLHSLELSEQETQIPPVRLGSGTGGMGTISFYSYDGLMLRQTESYDLISAKLY